MQHPDHVAPVHVAHSGVEAPEPRLLGLESEGWVYVGLTIFILVAIIFGKAPKRIRDALDQRIADTRRSLDDAAALRREAEALLADAHARQRQAEADAAAILSHARAEAEALTRKTEADLSQLIERRTRLAEEKIHTEERQAVAEVRAQAAEAAVAAARRLIAEQNDAGADRRLVDQAIGALGR